MAKEWMEGQDGIPTAFLIDRHGRIAWIGEPQDLKSAMIEQVLGGTFDITQAAKEYRIFKTRQDRLNELSLQLHAGLDKSDWDGASKALAEIDEIERPLSADDHSDLDKERIAILLGRKDLDRAAALSLQLSERKKADVDLQNELAWNLAWEYATGHETQISVLESAATIAQRGNAASRNENPFVLHTLARIRFLQGQKSESIRLQERAIQLGKDKARTAGATEKRIGELSTGEIARSVAVYPRFGGRCANSIVPSTSHWVHGSIGAAAVI